MKKLVLWMIAIAAFSGSALFGQDLTGTWQGTLQAGGRDLRLVYKVSKEGTALKAVMYSIDQSPQGFPASSATLQGSTVKFSIAGVGGTYDGKLSVDGNSIVGTWTQGPSPAPLNLTRATTTTAWEIPVPPPPPTPMAADASPTFEVATIKPSNPEAPGRAIRVNGRNFSTLNTTLSDLITFAYGLHPKQITAGPAWLETDRFDIAAKPDGTGQPNDRQWKMMIQKLLVERFKFTFHRDKKELSVYAITIGKSGSKLTKSEADQNGLPSLFFAGMGRLPARNATVTDLANLLQSVVLDRPVVEQTGLQGRFDFTLNWTPDAFQFGGAGARAAQAANNLDAPPDLFSAMEQQLGLKLESTKAPADVLVIDRVEKPSEN